jgi:hypothetical protein
MSINVYQTDFYCLLKVDPKYVRNLKFTKRHNRVARKNLLKVRTAKLAAPQGSSPSKVVKRGPPRQVEAKKTSWSLSSLLKNVTSYFTGETEKTEQKKRPKRTHTSKKSAKAAAAATATKPAEKK